MTDGKQPEKDREFLDRLHRAFEEAYAEDAPALRALLSDAGVDPDVLVSNGMVAIEQLRRQQELAQLRMRLEQMRSDVMHALRSVQVDPAKIRGRIAKALAGSDARLAQVYYHKLEAVDPEDLASLPEDEAILALFERVADEDEAGGG